MAAFSATGQLLSVPGKAQSGTAAFGGVGSLSATINDGLRAVIIGGVPADDGLSAIIIGGGTDGLTAEIGPGLPPGVLQPRFTAVGTFSAQAMQADGLIAAIFRLCHCGTDCGSEFQRYGHLLSDRELLPNGGRHVYRNSSQGRHLCGRAAIRGRRSHRRGHTRTAVSAALAGAGTLSATVTGEIGHYYADNFNRANGAPGANWSLFTAGAANLAIVSNELKNSAGEWQGATWAAPIPGKDHRVGYTVGSIVPDIVYMFVRGNPDNQVLVGVYANGNLKMYTQNGDYITGDGIEQTTGSLGTACATGQKITFEAVGHNYIVKLNGVTKLTWTDSGGVFDPYTDFSHRLVTFGVYPYVTGTAAIDDFIADDLSSGAHYADNFNRANGSAGSDWTSYASVGGLVISSNEVVTTGGDVRQILVRNSAMSTNNHRVGFTIGSSYPSSCYLYLRASTTRRMLAYFTFDGGAYIFEQSGDYTTGSFTQRGGDDSLGTALAPGQKLTFEAVGTTYNIRLNGVIKSTWTDTAGDYTPYVDSSHRQVAMGMRDAYGATDDFIADDL